LIKAYECLKIWWRKVVITGTQSKKRKADEMVDEQADGNEVL
jgi:hypothetical protein